MGIDTQKNDLFNYNFKKFKNLINFSITSIAWIQVNQLVFHTSC